MTTSTFAPDREAFRAMLATLATKTKTKIPELNGRVERALRLALAGDVELHDNGTATVYSSSDPTRRYEIIEGTCTCQDWDRAPQHLCQHRLSAGLVRRTYALLPQEPVDPELLEPFPDNDPGPLPEPEPVEAPEPTPSTPLPEVAFSITLKGTLDGVEALLTARGATAAEFTRNLQAIRGLLDPGTPRASTRPMPPVHEAPVCPYHGAMKASTKAPGTWYCAAKMGDGSYCKERSHA